MAGEMDAAVRDGYCCAGSGERCADNPELADGEEHGVFLRGDVGVLGDIRACAGVRIVVSSKYLRSPFLLWWASYV